MESYSNDEIVEGIRSQKREILGFVYKNYFYDVKSLVLKYGGSIDDAKDYFQEAIIIIYRKLKEGDITINKSFQQYLIGVCRNIFIEQKTKDSILKEELEQIAEFEQIEETDSFQIRKNYEYRLYQDHFKKLGKICQDILTLILKKVPVREIADKLKTTEGYIHSRKYKCKEQLINNIKSDPKFGKQDDD